METEPDSIYSRAATTPVVIPCVLAGQERALTPAHPIGSPALVGLGKKPLNFCPHIEKGRAKATMIPSIRHQQHGQSLHTLADQEHGSDLSTARSVSSRGEDIRNIR